MGGKASNKEQLWAEARRRCRLSAEAVAMAKELGLNPQKLQPPSPSQGWKAPVDDWIRSLYAKRQERTEQRRRRRERLAMECGDATATDLPVDHPAKSAPGRPASD